MKIHNLSGLPAEMSSKLDGLIDNLATVTEAIRIAEEERKRLRDELGCVDILSQPNESTYETQESHITRC